MDIDNEQTEYHVLHVSHNNITTANDVHYYNYSSTPTIIICNGDHSLIDLLGCCLTKLDKKVLSGFRHGIVNDTNVDALSLKGGGGECEHLIGYWIVVTASCMGDTKGQAYIIYCIPYSRYLLGGGGR